MSAPNGSVRREVDIYDGEYRYVDGNAAAAVFAEAFRAEVSAATLTCATCVGPAGSRTGTSTLAGPA